MNADKIREILNDEAARILAPRRNTPAKMNAASGLRLFAKTATDEELQRFRELLTAKE